MCKGQVTSESVITLSFSHIPLFTWHVCLSSPVFKAALISLSWHLKRMHMSVLTNWGVSSTEILVCVRVRSHTAVVTSGLKQQWQMGQGSGRRGSRKLGHHSTVCLSLSLHFALLSWNFPLSLCLFHFCSHPSLTHTHPPTHNTNHLLYLN